MSNVEFETDQQQYGSRLSPNQQNNSGGMAGWLVRKGIIKDESQAGAVLIAVVIINFLLTAFLIYKYVL